MNRIASGTHRYGVGSDVPVQSNSKWNLERSIRSEFAPWLTLVGTRPSRRSRLAHRNPAPFGAHIHLWQLPT